MRRAEASGRNHRGFVSSFLGWLIRGIWFLCQILLSAWAILAIYYSNLPWAGLRLALAAAFAAFSIWAIWPSRQRSVLFLVLFLGLPARWLSIPPSPARPSPPAPPPPPPPLPAPHPLRPTPP